MAGFLSRLVTKICRVLTTRTMDDEDAPGLKAVLNFHVPDEVEPEDVVDPDEMTTLESRLGSLIQHNTITRAPAFKAITSFNEQVIAPQEVDIPGWSICERVVDIKTRAQAMKCLTNFSKAMGTSFIIERTSKIMKEHKNPKVLSEGLLWMVFAIDDFGVAHLKLKDVFDFCNDIGLQSSAAATTIIATIKLIGVLHKLVGSDIKAFLSDVMPALLSVIEAECEKNPFEKTVMASHSVSSVFGSGLDSLPREDNSRKITPKLLKGLECSDWKVNEHCTISHIVDYAQMGLESIEAVNKIVEEANKRIHPTGTVELFGALTARLYDGNHNLFMANLTSISGLEYAMGPAIEKSSMGIVSDIVKCIGDNKKHMRECTSWVASTDLDKMRYK
ncbi:protein MOR1 [Tanacetum coccineum]